jgi:hypothetical protein
MDTNNDLAATLALLERSIALVKLRREKTRAFLKLLES